MSTNVFDFEAPTPLRPLSSNTRAALVAEFRAARADGDAVTVEQIHAVATAHDEAWPDEPSLCGELLAVQAAEIQAKVADYTAAVA